MGLERCSRCINGALAVLASMGLSPCVNWAESCMGLDARTGVYSENRISGSSGHWKSK